MKFDKNNKLNDNKSIYTKWKKIYALTATEVDKKRVTYFPFCEVDMKSLPPELEDDIFDLYVKPSIKDYVKPDTYEKFKDIV
jgi:hypothetical protein